MLLAFNLADRKSATFKVKLRTTGKISREEKPPEKGKVLVGIVTVHSFLDTDHT